MTLMLLVNIIETLAADESVVVLKRHQTYIIYIYQYHRYTLITPLLVRI
jgi:hypothetical protein